MHNEENIYDCQRHPLIGLIADIEYSSGLEFGVRAPHGEVISNEQKNIEVPRDVIEKVPIESLCGIKYKKEATTMQISYNGFTGELVKLERHIVPGSFIRDEPSIVAYDLSIYDSERQATHSFTSVKLEDVKFLGGAVTFGT